MKTKEQKRLEAILRLEREPRGSFLQRNPEIKTAVAERRKAEASRLRTTFSEQR